MRTKISNQKLTLEQFHEIAKGDVNHAISRAMQEPDIANLLTFEYFHTMLMYQTQYALLLAKVPSLNKIIDSQEKFIEICSLNFEAASALLMHPDIAKIAEPIKAFMPYYNYKQHTPHIREKRLTSPSIAPLDLALKLKKKRLANMDDVFKPSLFGGMNLENLDKAKAVSIFLSKFPTLKKYCDLMMYGPSGYYATGKVDFTNHFLTFASVPSEVAGFSAAMAHQLFHTRIKLISQKKLKPTDKFNVLECGGGNGDLCFNILTTISKMAQFNAEWKQLFQSLNYHLVDLSPELVKRQQQRTREFSLKVKVIHGDVRTFIKEMAGTQIAAVLSNELLDMFAPHELCLLEGNIRVGVMLPFVHKYTSNEYFSKALKESGLSLEKLLADSEKYKALYLMLNPEDNKIQLQSMLTECLLLSESSFLKLHRITAREKKCPELFKFIKANNIDAQWIPEVAEFLKRNPQFAERVQESQFRFAEVGIHNYLEMLYPLLIPGGEIISVDYGNIENLLIDALRIALPGGRINADIRINPGFQDITKDVNFSILAREGELSGYETLFYGEQSQLNTNRFPESVLSTYSNLLFQASSQKRDFKVMVQQKADGHGTKHHPLAPERFNGNSKPVNFDELFSEMKNKIKQQTVQQTRSSFKQANTNTQATTSLYPDLSPLLKKYNLKDSTQTSLETGLRNAAANNKISDLQLFIKLVKNINAQDTNPQRKCTALHWAAIKNHTQVYQLLINAGANPDIQDARNKTANDYQPRLAPLK